MGRLMASVLLGLSVMVGIAQGADWSDAEGSAFAKGVKVLGVGGCIADFGAYANFDVGVHDAISVGGAVGYTHWGTTYWSYHQIPIAVRGAFHPFNLAFLADKIKVRDKLDVYIGLNLGWKIGFGGYTGPSSVITPAAAYIPGFFFRESIGARWYFNPKICVFLEEGSGFGIFNGGIGFKF